MKKLIIALVIVTLSWGWGLAEDRDDTYSERLGVYDWYYNNGMPFPDKLPKHYHWEYMSIRDGEKIPEGWEPFGVIPYNNKWDEKEEAGHKIIIIRSPQSKGLIWLKRRVCD